MSTPGNQRAFSISWGASAVLTLGSNPAHGPRERTNVRVVAARAVRRAAPSLGTNSATTAPTAGRKITQETRCGIEARRSMQESVVSRQLSVVGTTDHGQRTTD